MKKEVSEQDSLDHPDHTETMTDEELMVISEQISEGGTSGIIFRQCGCRVSWDFSFSIIE